METLNVYNVNQQSHMGGGGPVGYLEAYNRGVELGATKNNTSWWSERNLSPQPAHSQSGALTIRPRAVLSRKLKGFGYYLEQESPMRTNFIFHHILL